MYDFPLNFFVFKIEKIMGYRIKFLNIRYENNNFVEFLIKNYCRFPLDFSFNFTFKL